MLNNEEDKGKSVPVELADKHSIKAKKSVNTHDGVHIK